MRSDARKATVDGYVFDSKAEARRYSELKMLERAREIGSLEVHPVFMLNVDHIHICNYTADFRYIQKGKVVVEDVKGFKMSKKTGKMLPRVDREFHLKRKLLIALYGIELQIVA